MNFLVWQWCSWIVSPLSSSDDSFTFQTILTHLWFMQCVPVCWRQQEFPSGLSGSGIRPFCLKEVVVSFLRWHLFLEHDRRFPCFTISELFVSTCILMSASGLFPLGLIIAFYVSHWADEAWFVYSAFLLSHVEDTAYLGGALPAIQPAWVSLHLGSAIQGLRGVLAH